VIVKGRLRWFGNVEFKDDVDWIDQTTMEVDGTCDTYLQRLIFTSCCMNEVCFSLLMHVWENWKRKLDSTFQLQTAWMTPCLHLLCGRQVLCNLFSI